MKDPYRILNVSQNAEIGEIKRAFRTRARQCHPDSDRHNPNAEDEFKTLLNAYEIISDAAKRARYDRGEIDGDGNPVRASTNRTNDSGKPPSSDGAANDTGRPATGFKAKGTDVTYLLAVTFEQAAKGVTHHIDMVTGKKLAIKVPPGALNGQVLRLKGEGMPGIGGRAAGDALVELQVAPHPILNQDGHNVRGELPITLQEAVLGGHIDVPTLNGSVKMTVPPGSNTGSVLRLRNKGLPRPEGGCGDQYITLRVVLPPAPDDEFVEFVEKWHAKHPYQVRQP